jgi:transcriptional regulator with XRE-family HTH domain
MEKFEDLGRRLQIIRGDTPSREMGRRAGITGSGWAKFEKGTSPPGGAVLTKLAEMGYSPTWILTGEGPMRIESSPTLIINADKVGQQIGTNNGDGTVIGFNLVSEKLRTSRSTEGGASKRLTPILFSEEKEEICDLIRCYANSTLLNEFRERLLKIKVAMGE